MKFLISVGSKGSTNATCGSLSIFIIKGNAKIQLEVSKNTVHFFSS